MNLVIKWIKILLLTTITCFLIGLINYYCFSEMIATVTIHGHFLSARQFHTSDLMGPFSTSLTAIMSILIFIFWAFFIEGNVKWKTLLKTLLSIYASLISIQILSTFMRFLLDNLFIFISAFVIGFVIFYKIFSYFLNTNVDTIASSSRQNEVNRLLFLIYSILLFLVFVSADLIVTFYFIMVICNGEGSGCHPGIIGNVSVLLLFSAGIFCWLAIVKKLKNKMLNPMNTMLNPNIDTLNKDINNFQ